MRIYQVTILQESFKDAELKFTNETNDEDVVVKYIDEFKRLVNKNIIQGSDKDIGKWIKAGWEEFKSFVDASREKPSKQDIKKKRVNKDNESIILVDNDEYTAVLPLTERASCFYGKKTNWCVSVVSKDNMFNDYVASGRFPVHIKKDDKQYSIVYGIFQNDIVEIRGETNDSFTQKDFAIKVVEPDEIISELKKHTEKLKEVSKSKSLLSSRSAYLYALNRRERFEDGEKLIAEDFMYSLRYMRNVLEYSKNTVIEKTLFENIKNIFSQDEKEIKGIIDIIKKYLDIHYLNNKLPSYANKDDIIKVLPTFYFKHIKFTNQFISPQEFNVLIDKLYDYKNKTRSKEITDNDLTPIEFFDFTGYGEFGEALEYIRYLYDNNKKFEEYLSMLFNRSAFEITSKDIVNYIKDNGYYVGFSDVLLKEMPDRMSVSDVIHIVDDADNGEYIFKLIKPEQLPPKVLYKIIKKNSKVLGIIGNIPQSLKDYMDKEGLTLK